MRIVKVSLFYLFTEVLLSSAGHAKSNNVHPGLSKNVNGEDLSSPILLKVTYENQEKIVENVQLPVSFCDVL